MADGFADPNDVLWSNPYMSLPGGEMPRPHWTQVLGNALVGVGAGISNADAGGRGWGSGIAPGLMLANQLTNQQQQQAMQWQMMSGYRKAMEEKARAEAEAKREELDLDRQALSYFKGMQPPGAASAPVPGMSVPPPGPRMGPDFTAAAKPQVDYLVNKHGFSPAQAAAVVGNLYQESGFNPTAVGDNGTAYGQAQWRGDRQTGLVNFANAQGKPPSDPNVQLDYLVSEMKGGDMGAQRAYALLQQAKTPEEATAAMMHFFRPAGYTPANPTAGHGFQQRVQYTQAIQGGNPQIAANAPPATVMPPRIDPMQYAPLLVSKRLAPLGKGMIDIGNTETQRYLQDQDREMRRQQEAEKQRLAVANAEVDPVTMRPNKAKIEAGTEAERQKMALKYVPALDRTTGQWTMVPQTQLGDRYVSPELQKAQIEAANSPVSPGGQVQQAPIEAAAQAAAAKSEAEAKVKLKNDAALKLSAAEMERYSKDVRPAIEATVNSLPNLYEMKRLTEGPLASGSFIDSRQAGARILDTLGIQPMSDGMVNRSEFNNRAGKNVLSFLQTRALGSGSGISEGDRKFVETMAAKGDYTTEEVKRLTDIAIGSAHTSVKQHDATVKRLKGLAGVADAASDDYWKVDAPTYDEWAKANPAVKPTPAGDVQQMGGTYTPQLDPKSILQNMPAPKDKAAYDALPAGSVYLHPDGTFKRKPEKRR